MKASIYASRSQGKFKTTGKGFAMNKCDVCGKESKEVVAGRWLFYCKNNAECKQKEVNKVYDNELAPALQDGYLDDYEVLEHFI